MFFWDYGNAFLLEASRVGADVLAEDGSSDIQVMLKTLWVQFALIMDLVLTDGFVPSGNERLSKDR